MVLTLFEIVVKFDVPELQRFFVMLGHILDRSEAVPGWLILTVVAFEVEESWRSNVKFLSILDVCMQVKITTCVVLLTHYTLEDSSFGC